MRYTFTLGLGQVSVQSSCMNPLCRKLFSKPVCNMFTVAKDKCEMTVMLQEVDKERNLSFGCSLVICLPQEGGLDIGSKPDMFRVVQIFSAQLFDVFGYGCAEH